MVEWTDAEIELLLLEQQAIQPKNSAAAERRNSSAYGGRGGDVGRGGMMQRSMSLSNMGLHRRDSQRVVIRPDPAFTQFDPENDDDDLSDDHDMDNAVFTTVAAAMSESARMTSAASDDAMINAADNNNVNKQLHQVRTSTSSTMRPKIVRRSRGSIGGSTTVGLGTSLSNLSSVSEAPMTASAVSNGQTQRPPNRRSRGLSEQISPHIILSTPCGTILEEHKNDNICMNMTNTNHQHLQQHRRSSSIKSKVYNSNPAGSGSVPVSASAGENSFAWQRRHSLHSQPQPLSVQGFGYRYNTNTASSMASTASNHRVLERSTALAAAAKMDSHDTTNSLNRRRLNMVAALGRRASDHGLEDHRGQRPTASMASTNKETTRSHSRLPRLSLLYQQQRRASHGESFHKLTVVF